MQYIREHIGKFLEFRTSNGYEYVSRKNSHGIVSILAITADKKIILTEQFRIPVNKKVIESPAGLVDQGETPLESAKRELMEETGYESTNWWMIYENLPSSAGLTDESKSKYIALDCIKTGEGGGLKSENENITVHLVEFDLILPWLSDKIEIDGATYDPNILSGLFIYEKQKAEYEKQ